jgi:hypothetical protein
MYDKVAGIWMRPAIKKAAQTRDYFSQEIETRLNAEVEGPANTTLNRLGAGLPLDEAGRQSLAVYIAVMLKRVPRSRRLGYERLPEVRTSTFSRIRGEVAHAADELGFDRVRELLTQLEELEARYEQELPTALVEQVESPWPTDTMVRALWDMTWRLAPAPRDLFYVTSDNPAYYFDAYGIGSENSELVFPITSRLALHGSFQGVARTTIDIKPRPGFVREINRRVISGAERFVFSPTQASWIETVAQKQEPYLSRILW